MGNKKERNWENKENSDYFQKLEGNSEEKERSTGISQWQKKTLRKREIELCKRGRKFWD